MNKKHPLVIVFLLFFAFQCSGQLLNSFKKLRDSKIEVSEKINKLDSLVRYADSMNLDSLDYLYIKYAYWMYDYDLPKTINLSEKAKKIAVNSEIKDSSLLNRIFLELGYYYGKSLDYRNAISYYKKAQDWTKSKRKLSTTYEKIGFCYSRIKDYYRASENYKIAAGLLDNSEKYIEKRKSLNYDISLVLSKQNTIESLIESRRYAKKVDSLGLAYPQYKKNGFAYKFHHAEIYSNDLSLDTLMSSKLFQEAYDMAQRNSDTLGMIQTLFGRGGLYNSTNQEKSKQFHYEALSLIDSKDSINLYLNLYALGKTLAYEGNYSESSQKFISSLQYLTGRDFSDPQRLLKNDTLFLKNADELIYCLPLLGETYLKWYEETKNKNYLDKSLGYFQFTDRIIDDQKENSKDFLSRLLWRKKGTDLYGKALRACYLLKDYDQALYFMEKNKALLLMEDISQSELNKSINNNPLYIQREKTLKKEIFSISRLLKNNNNSEKRFELLKQKMDLELDLSLLQDSIYGYNKTLQYDPAQLKIADVQKGLEEDEVFVEYHVSVDNEYGIYSNNEKGYVLMVSKNNRLLLEIDQLDQLYLDIIKATGFLKTPLDTKSKIEEYNKLTHNIYLKLFPGSAAKELLVDKKLTLSLDYYLHFLPFEALSTSPDQSDYLIHKAEISYVYSYTFGENNVRDNLPVSKKIIAFAPQNFKDDALIPLQHTEAEINVIEENISGKYYRKTSAHKKAFIDESSDYAIIHLATHAYSSIDSIPWISFYDEKLTLDELYLVENNASLVVLSACNTNIGKLEVGEGVMSLARGFFYGGTQSVVSTLWNVDDKSTSAILRQFYANLKKGDDKSQALHNAKLTYLENNSLSELSPYYWSSLVLIGDTSALPLSGSISSGFYFIIIAIALLLFALFILKRKQKGK